MSKQSNRLLRPGLLRMISAAILLATTLASADTRIEMGSPGSGYVLTGTLVTPARVFAGAVVVQGDTITCAAEDCEVPQGATVLAITDAFIFPGFVDAHNHVAYNILPKWTPPKLYKNRSQWQGAPQYTAFKKPYSDLKDQKKLFCEMVKYGEVKALISGITTIQGTSPGSDCVRTLIRNAENQNELGVSPDHVRTYILDISSYRQQPPDWTQTRSFVVHLAEGTDLKSRDEFKTLKQKRLLHGSTAIIHGTAFTDAEFREMAAVGAKLVWSPRSNLVLYGQTTDIKAARAAGVPVSLGVDWNPTGSDTVFDELRTAAEVNEEVFGGDIADAEWLPMVTSNPAKALGLEDYVGRLEKGLKADIVVIAQRDADPGRSLLKTQLLDVEQVWVGGKVVYGSSRVVQRLGGPDCEPIKVQGVTRRVCVKSPRAGVPKSEQTLMAIRQALQAAYPRLAPLSP